MKVDTLAAHMFYYLSYQRICILRPLSAPLRRSRYPAGMWVGCAA